jgi:branched-chain amino acid transport system ATP-binding protein
VIENLVGTCETLVQEGVGLLLIEQNLGVAASLANRQLVMVAGAIQAETTGAALLADPDGQQRYLGVTRIEETADTAGDD